MTGLNGETGAIVPFCRGADVVGNRSFAAQLEQTPALSCRIIVEALRELALVIKGPAVTTVMNQCKTMGIRFALDDFGTGYSSLSILKALPTDTLKIDQSFVSAMLTDQEDLAIVKSIINLSTTFHRQVIAEGVETFEQGIKLLKLGCDHAQGYCISRPMPTENVLDWIKHWQQPEVWHLAVIEDNIIHSSR